MGAFAIVNMNLYYWLFWNANKNRLAMLAWRKLSGMITAWKHVRRHNWRQAAVWLWWVIKIPLPARRT